MTAKELAPIILDPKQIFGASATAGWRSTAELVGVPPGELKNDPNWHQRFVVAGARDIEKLPFDCLPKGTIILDFQANGRIDRHQVVGEDVIGCFYRPGRDAIDRFIYSLSQRHIGIGKKSEWYYKESHSSSRHLAKTVRILIIEPKADK